MKPRRTLVPLRFAPLLILSLLYSTATEGYEQPSKPNALTSSSNSVKSKNFWETPSGFLLKLSENHKPGGYQVHLGVSLLFYRSGDSEQALEVLNRGLKLAQLETTAELRARALMSVASYMARIDQDQRVPEILRQTKDQAKQIENHGSRASLLRRIALTQLEYDLEDEAEVTWDETLNSIMKLPNGSIRDNALNEFALEVAGNGRGQFALKIAQHLEDPRVSESTYFRMAITLGKNGDVEKALAVLDENIDKQNIRQAALGHIATERGGRAGDLETALKLVDQIESEREQNSVLKRIAEELSSQGELSDALKVVQTIQDARIRQTTLRKLAFDGSNSGQYEVTLKIVELLEDQATRNSVLRNLAHMLSTEAVTDSDTDDSRTPIPRRVKKSFSPEELEIAKRIAEAMSTD